MAHLSLCRRTQTLREIVVPLLLPSCFLVACAVGCTDAPNYNDVHSSNSVPHRRIPNAESRYIGSSSCADCHKEISKTYSRHPMANSLAQIKHALPVESSETNEFTSVNHLAYVVEETDTGIWHHEIRRNADGQQVYDQKVPVHFAIGSGTRGRSYLSEIDGRLFQSPITWYVEKEKWDLSPGFVPGSHARFDRRVSHACLACHAGISNLHETDPDRFAAPPFLEESIGCERCHGPASDHVAYHKEISNQSAQVDPIVNPSLLSSSLQDAVCNQCHLQGQRRVLNSGRTEFDFRPGMSLNDVWTTILKTQGVNSGTAEAVSQVEQMHASRCFQGSKGTLKCTSCHDPHFNPAPDEADAVYRSACQKCHGANESDCTESEKTRQLQADSCISCHMPHFGAADVHTSQTDHRILRRLSPAVSDQQAPIQRLEQLTFFREPDFQATDPAQERAAGIYLAELGYLGKDDTAARQAVTILTPGPLGSVTDVELLFSLSKAYLQLGRIQDATEVLNRVAELSPRNEEVFELLATTAHENGHLARARKNYEKLLSLNPDRARYYGRYAHVLGQLGDVGASIQAGEKALMLDPSLSQAHAWLVGMYKLRGDDTNAKIHQERFELFQSPTIK